MMAKSCKLPPSGWAEHHEYVRVPAEDFKRLMAVVTAADIYVRRYEGVNSKPQRSTQTDVHYAYRDLMEKLEAYETAENDRGKGKEND
jgi:hypothetical protein